MCVCVWTIFINTQLRKYIKRIEKEQALKANKNIQGIIHYLNEEKCEKTDRHRCKEMFVLARQSVVQDVLLFPFVKQLGRCLSQRSVSVCNYCTWPHPEHRSQPCKSSLDQLHLRHTVSLETLPCLLIIIILSHFLCGLLFIYWQRGTSLKKTGNEI